MFLNALKGSWIKRIMDDQNNGQWKLAYLEIIKKYGGKLIFECDLTKEMISEMVGKNNFLKEIILSLRQSGIMNNQRI